MPSKNTSKPLLFTKLLVGEGIEARVAVSRAIQ